MTYWRWDSGLSSAEIRERIAMSVLERSNAVAAGPCCSLFAEAQRQDRRQGQDAYEGLERRRYGAALHG